MLGKSTRDAAADADARQQTAGRGASRGERRVAAWIGASLVIKGDLLSSEDTTLAGRVQGNVDARSHALVIEPGATIEGDVHARTVTVHGEVTGKVTAVESIDIGQTGAIFGDVEAPRMSVAEGALLQGRLRIMKSAGQGGGA